MIAFKNSIWKLLNHPTTPPQKQKKEKHTKQITEEKEESDFPS